MPDFLKRFGRGAVAGGEGATAGLLQHLLMQREQERYAGEQAEEQQMNAMQRLLWQSQIDEGKEPEKLTEAGVRGAALQKFLQDPEFEREYKRGLLAKLQPKGEAGRIFGGAPGGYYQQQAGGGVEKIVPGRPTTEKPAIDPEKAAGFRWELEKETRDPDSPFFEADVDSLFATLFTKVGEPVPGRAQPQRSTIMDEIMRGGEQPQQQDPEIQKARQALERGDITQEEFDEFVKERNASYVR